MLGKNIMKRLYSDRRFNAPFYIAAHTTLFAGYRVYGLSIIALRR